MLTALAGIRSGIEDMKRQLDAIVKAMIAPQLGRNDREARTRFAKHIKTELAVRIWNAIDGKRDVGDISRLVSRKPQVVNNYINRWEQTTPPLVYVYTETSGARVYKRIYPIRMKAKPKKQAVKIPETLPSPPSAQAPSV
jgi:hypothetical protein